MTSLLAAIGYLGMFLKCPPAAKYDLMSHYLGRQYKKMVVLGYEIKFISFYINLVASSNKTCACLVGIWYQGMLVKTLAAPPNA